MLAFVVKPSSETEQLRPSRRFVAIAALLVSIAGASSASAESSPQGCSSSGARVRVEARARRAYVLAHQALSDPTKPRTGDPTDLAVHVWRWEPTRTRTFMADRDFIASGGKQGWWIVGRHPKGASPEACEIQAGYKSLPLKGWPAGGSRGRKREADAGIVVSEHIVLSPTRAFAPSVQHRRPGESFFGLHASADGLFHGHARREKKKGGPKGLQLPDVVTITDRAKGRFRVTSAPLVTGDPASDVLTSRYRYVVEGLGLDGSYVVKTAYPDGKTRYVETSGDEGRVRVLRKKDYKAILKDLFL